MRRPPRALVAAVAAPFLAGCFSVTQVPVPAAHPDREALQLRGVVVVDPDNGSQETLEFQELHQATWTPSSLSFVADVRADGRTETVTRLVPITELQGLLVRQLDAGKTSAIIGGMLVGGIAAVALIVTGEGDRYGPGD